MAAEEPEHLHLTRERLARAEAAFPAEDSVFHLEEALALLDEVVRHGEPTHRTVARNLAATYAAKFFGSIRRLMETDRGLPEPELERFFRIALAFDYADVELPAEAGSIKIELVRRLIDRSYEGYSAAEKRQALQRLEEIAAGAKRGRSKRSTKR